MIDDTPTRYALDLDVFELGLLYGLIQKEVAFADEDHRMMYDGIIKRIVELRRTMDHFAGKKITK